MRAKILTLVICSLILSSVLPAKKKREANFWKKLFTDPIERVYIIMKDSTIINYTSLYNDRVYISIRRLEKTLEKFKNKNYSIKNEQKIHII